MVIMGLFAYGINFSRKHLTLSYHNHLIFILEAIIAFCFAMLFAIFFGDHESYPDTWKKLTLKDWALLSVSSLFGVLISLVTISIVNEGELSQIMSLSTGIELLIAILAGYFLLNEKLSIKKLIGFIILIIALLLLG